MTVSIKPLPPNPTEMLFLGSHVFCKLAFHPHNRRKTEGKPKEKVPS